jgi:hypothetical protein
MNYVLLKNYDHYAIVNDDADFIVGRAYPTNGREGPFRVVADLTPDDCDNDQVAVVSSIEEAVPALAAYYEKNPPPWESKTAARYEKWTQFALLRVEHDRGNWLAYRDDHPMLRNGTLAKFTTSEEARRAADAHLLDMYPNAEPIYDGLSWLPDPELDWRSCPHRVEARADWQRMASRWLPNAA